MGTFRNKEKVAYKYQVLSSWDTYKDEEEIVKEFDNIEHAIALANKRAKADRSSDEVYVAKIVYKVKAKTQDVEIESETYED